MLHDFATLCLHLINSFFPEVHHASSFALPGLNNAPALQSLKEASMRMTARCAFIEGVMFASGAKPSETRQAVAAVPESTMVERQIEPTSPMDCPRYTMFPHMAMAPIPVMYLPPIPFQRPGLQPPHSLIPWMARHRPPSVHKRVDWDLRPWLNFGFCTDFFTSSGLDVHVFTLFPKSLVQSGHSETMHKVCLYKGWMWWMTQTKVINRLIENFLRQCLSGEMKHNF